MVSEKAQALIEELRAWCKTKYGRSAKIARILGVSPQQVADWFAGRSLPTLETGLEIQEFLRKERKRRRKKKDS